MPPRATPAAVVARLQEAVAKVLAAPDTATRFATQGTAPRFMSAAQLTAFEAAETAKWQEAVTFSGAKLD